MQKRIVSLFLVLVMLVSLFPAPARAAETASNVDSGVAVEGTNGFGALLSDEITQYQSDMAQGDYPGGYTVTDLEISGRYATVTYDAMEEAQLVVALYTEDGMQLLTSGKTTVDPTEDIATVTIEGDMPEYFMASAYLLDIYDLSPLCTSYDTPMYTREMQELLASTVEDYDADRVLQLDEDKTTNFAVYAEDTILIEEQAGVNTVASINDETSTYVIENADENITALQEGDVFAYPYGADEFLIVKVGSIQVDGTTVTIIGTDLEMEEVFSHVKMESTTDSSDVVVTDLDPNDGIDYQGSGSAFQSRASTMAWEGDGGMGATEHFGLDKTVKNTKENMAVNIRGGLDFTLRFNYRFYVSLERQYLQLTLDATIALSASVSGEISTDFKNFAKFKVGPVHGVIFECKPVVEFSFSGEAQLAATVSTTLGFAYDSEKGFANLCTTPKVTAKLDVEGEIFVGVDLNPDAIFVSKYITELDMSVPLGVTVSAEFTGTDFDEVSPWAGDVDSAAHACSKCLDIAISVQPKIDIELKFLNCERLTYEESYTLASFSWPFYKSFTYDTFGMGDCPYSLCRITVQVVDSDGNPAAGVPVNAEKLNGEDEESLGTTNSQGILVAYLKEGQYLFTVPLGRGGASRVYTVSGACKVTLVLGESDGLPDMGDYIENPVFFMDQPAAFSGVCGPNLTWKIIYGGRMDYFRVCLVITGTGPMYDYNVPPWWDWHGDIDAVIIGDGVTTIGYGAFSFCDMESVTLPDSVTTIGDFAFSYCRKLGAVSLPEGVTTIGEGAFCGCAACVFIPASVTTIGEGAFTDSFYYGIKVDPGNPNYSSDDRGVLFNKDKTTLIRAPKYLEGSYTIPASVTTIGESAFYNCTKLTSVTIPDGVTAIGVYVFNDCEKLTSVTIPDGVTIIDEYAFENCPLTTVTIPASLTTIVNNAFSLCWDITDVYYGGTEAQWNQISIGYGNEYLTDATIHFSRSGAAEKLLAAAPYVQQSSVIPEETAKAEIPDLCAVFGGEYTTEEQDAYTLKTASFTGLVPNEQYVLLALGSISADPAYPNNLLFIDQAAAGEDGTLTFRYVPRVAKETSYVIVCGPSNKNLDDAVITFPQMTSDGTLQVVNPTVAYKGRTLTEGRDYVILGTVDYSQPGTYTCCIRGIYQYAGLVECSYTVTDKSEVPPVEETEPTTPSMEETEPQQKPTEPESSKPTEPEDTKPTEPEDTKPTEPDEPKYENPFEDVFEADYYYDPVLWAVNEGITNGMDATHFAPAGTCTRAQIVTFLWRANGSPTAGDTNPFTDVPADAWYTDAVLWAVEEGITTGTSATTFSPDAGCTRGQVATFLWRSQGQPEVSGENIFTDIAPGAYYYDAVLWAVANGITNGMGEGLFAPDATCTRGQIVTFLYRAMK